MTLTKAVTELLAEIQREDLTEEEKKALAKYQHWLLGIKKTVSNSIDWHPYPQEKPTKPNYYLVSTTKWGVDIDPCGDGEHWDYYTSEDIIAWAELPKPYEG